jgi:hypothetical protein
MSPEGKAPLPPFSSSLPSSRFLSSPPSHGGMRERSNSEGMASALLVVDDAIRSELLEAARQLLHKTGPAGVGDVMVSRAVGPALIFTKHALLL